MQAVAYNGARTVDGARKAPPNLQRNLYLSNDFATT